MTDTVTAHHDYEAQQDDELSFVAGEIIKVTDHSNADWWLGTKQDGSSGYFPSNFVEAVKQDDNKPTTASTVDKEDDTVSNNEDKKDNITAKETKETTDEASPTQPRSSIGMARVMEDYAMQQDDELTLHKGAIVVLYERSEDGEWLQGEINGKQGRFPAKYVEDIDMPGRPDFGTNNTADVTSGSGDAGAAAGAPPPGGFKLAAFGVKQGGIGGLFAGGIPTLKKTSTVKSPTTESQPTTPPPAAVTASPTVPAPATTEQNPSLGKAMVLHPYDAENEDELNLIRGEYIDILDRNADEGWWQGRNEKNQTGVFPSNFVKEIEVGPHAPPPPVRTRKSVASVGAVTATPSPPTETRPFSTPTPTLQQHRPPTVSQRLPPLPDTAVPTTEQEDTREADELKVDTPVVDSAPAPSSPPAPETPVAPVDQPLEEPLPSPTKEQDKAATKEQTAPVETSQAIEQPPTTKSPTMPAAATEDTTSTAAAKEDTTPAAKEDTTPAAKEDTTSAAKEDTTTPAKEDTTTPAKEDTTTPAKEDTTTPASTTTEETTPPAAAEEEKEKEHIDVDKKDATLTTTIKQQDEDASAPSVEPSEPKDTEEEKVATSATSTVEPVVEEAQATTTAADDEQPKDVEQEDTKKGIDFGMPLPTSGPRLVAPSRTSRPSKAGARRPPTKPSTDDASPSQTELLQQELEKTPEEEKPASPAADTTGSPTSPPPKPIKPIFAKFPTAFTMGGGEGISAKNLKPVQRRMFEPSPAHEPSPSPPSNDTDEHRPTPGGVRGLASRFAGVPNSGGGNEVMETKLKNFTKNEVEKQRKEFEAQLEVERARITSLETMVATLMQQVDQLKNGC